MKINIDIEGRATTIDVPDDATPSEIDDIVNAESSPVKSEPTIDETFKTNMQRIGDEGATGKITPVEGVVQTMGEEARPVNTVVGRGIGAVLSPVLGAASSIKNVIPQPVRDVLKKHTALGQMYTQGKEAINAISPSVAETASSIAEQHPRLMHNVDALGQIAGVATMFSGLGAGRKPVGEIVEQFGKNIKASELKIPKSIAKTSYGKDIAEKKRTIIKDVADFGVTHGNNRTGAEDALIKSQQRFDKADEIGNALAANPDTPQLNPTQVAMKGIDVSLAPTGFKKQAQGRIDAILEDMALDGHDQKTTLDQLIKAKQNLNKDGKLFINGPAGSDTDPMGTLIRRKMYLNIVDAIGEISPEIKAMNTEGKRLLDVHAALSQAASREMNRDAVGLTDWIIGGAALAHPGSLSVAAPAFVAKKVLGHGRAGNLVINTGRMLQGKKANAIESTLENLANKPRLTNPPVSIETPTFARQGINVDKAIKTEQDIKDALAAMTDAERATIAAQGKMGQEDLIKAIEALHAKSTSNETVDAIKNFQAGQTFVNPVKPPTPTISVPEVPAAKPAAKQLTPEEILGKVGEEPTVKPTTDFAPWTQDANPNQTVIIDPKEIAAAAKAGGKPPINPALLPATVISTAGGAIVGEKSDPEHPVRGAIAGAIGGAMLPSMFLNKSERGSINVWHGSPYSSIKKFSANKIGSGEGIQNFGHGLYFTNKLEIAKYYQETLSDASNIKSINGKSIDSYLNNFDSNNGERDAALELFGYYNNKKDALDAINRLVKLNPNDYHNKMKSLLESLPDGSKFEYQHDKGAVYKVTLHKDKTPDQYSYLKWDKHPTEQQKKKISDAFEKEKGYEFTFDTQDDGNIIYNMLSDELGGDEQASKFLLKSGIDGIDYPAGTISGYTKKGARNYVVFDDNAITIDEVNGKPVQQPSDILSSKKILSQKEIDAIAAKKPGIDSYYNEIGGRRIPFEVQELSDKARGFDKYGGLQTDNPDKVFGGHGAVGTVLEGTRFEKLRAAIKEKSNGKIHVGNFHENILEKINNGELDNKDYVEGFIDADNNFLTRKEVDDGIQKLLDAQRSGSLTRQFHDQSGSIATDYLLSLGAGAAASGIAAGLFKGKKKK